MTGATLLLQTRTIDAFSRVWMRVDATTVDRRATFHADPEFPGVHSLQRSVYLVDLGTSLVPKRVDNFTVLEFLRPFLGIGMVATPQVLSNSIKAGR